MSLMNSGSQYCPVLVTRGVDRCFNSDGGSINWDVPAGGQLGSMMPRLYNFMYLITLKL